MVGSLQQKHYEEWRDFEAMAEQAVHFVGRLYRERGVITTLYNRPLVGRTPMQILQEHRYVAEVEQNRFNIGDSFPILSAMAEMELSPARIDLAKISSGFEATDKSNLQSYLNDELAESLNGDPRMLDKPQDVVLYGFGRIGRLVARLLMERAGNGEGLRLKAIVVRQGKGDDLAKRASLLMRDSVHGAFNGTIEVDRETNSIIANGHVIQVIYASSPDTIDYGKYGIENALICDNTGVWRDSEGLGLHLKAQGSSKVLLTAPGKGDIPNVVFGVNDNAIEADRNIVSAASCTTNAITPILKTMDDAYGIESGHIETVHAYTNDQNLIDNFHPKHRRGRGAPLNMIITETGAGKAVAKALPALKGKLTANAIRVPTPNVSMAIMKLNLNTEVDADTINAHLKWAAIESPLHRQIGHTASNEVASTDLVGSRHAGVVDSKATIAQGKTCVLYVWYDNEFGYTVQVLRCMQKMAGINMPLLPKAK
jgi:glyceraldehyde 3-phosphate dehydrogenase